jgi:hypothetical protein
MHVNVGCHDTVESHGRDVCCLIANIQQGHDMKRQRTAAKEKSARETCENTSTSSEPSMSETDIGSLRAHTLTDSDFDATAQAYTNLRINTREALHRWIHQVNISGYELNHPEPDLELPQDEIAKKSFVDEALHKLNEEELHLREKIAQFPELNLNHHYRLWRQGKFDAI